MQLTHISDTHGYHTHLTLLGGDVLVHSGDFTGGTHREMKQFLNFLNWMGKQPYKHKLLVAGNHDRVCEDMGYLETKAFTDHHGIDYLCDSGSWIDGRLFWGSPWQPEFCNWAFNLPRDGFELQHKWDLIPAKTSVLITHGPPSNVLDKNVGGVNCGCAALQRRTQELPNLELHCFGHIHEDYSSAPTHTDSRFKGDGFLSSNAAIWAHHKKEPGINLNPPVNIELT